jgi:hypothetical protein
MPTTILIMGQVKTMRNDNSRRKMNNKNDEEPNISNPLFGWLTAIFNFNKYSTKKKVSIIATLAILLLIIVYNETKEYRDKTYYNEKIEDLFIKAPKKEVSNLSIAIFQFNHDRTTDNESSIQDLVSNNFSSDYFVFTRFSHPLASNIASPQTVEKKYLKKFDIVIYGNIIQRGNYKAYDIFFVSKTKKTEIRDIKIEDGFIPDSIISMFYSLLPSAVKYKIQSMEALSCEKFNKRNLMTLSYFLEKFINDKVVKNFLSSEENFLLVHLCAKVNYYIGITIQSSIYLEKSISDCKIAADIVSLCNTIDYTECEELLGHSQYYYGKILLSCYEYDKGINALLVAKDTFTGIADKHEKFRVTWRKTIEKFKNFLPKDLSIVTNEEGDKILHLNKVVDNYNNVAAEIMPIVLAYEDISKRWAICKDYIGLCLFELGRQYNDKQMIANSTDVITESINEKTRKHYIKFFDYPINIDNDAIPISMMTNSPLVLDGYIAMKERYAKAANKYLKPMTWADFINEKANAISVKLLLGPNGSDIEKGIASYKKIIVKYKSKGLEEQVIKCNTRLSDLYLLKYIVNENKGNVDYIIAMKQYKNNINYCIDNGLSALYTENMLLLACLSYLVYCQNTDPRIITNTVQLYDELHSRADFLYGNDCCPTIDLADNIILFLHAVQSNDENKYKKILNDIDTLIQEFKHSSVLPKRSIAYYIACHISHKMFTITNEIKYEVLYEDNKEKAKKELSLYVLPIYSANNPLVQRIERIANSIMTH